MKLTGRILNLDDNAAARYLRTRALQLEGLEVIEAATGADALRMASECHPDIALLDVKLPDMSGLEVCRRLKASPATSDIPVVQVSATYVTAGDEAASFDHGADIYLTEPIETIVLVTVVQTLLRLRSTESGLLTSEERFKAIVNQATAGIVEIDLGGRLRHVNQHFGDLIGRAPDALYGFDWLAVAHPADADECRAKFHRLVEDGQPFCVDMRYVRPDGSTAWGSTSVSLVRDASGKPRHAIAVVIDITERKRTEGRDQFLAEVSERLAELSDQLNMLQKVTAAVVPAFADWCAVDLIEDDGTRKRIACSHIDPAKPKFPYALGGALARRIDCTDASEALPLPREATLIEDLSAPESVAGADEASLAHALREFGLRSYIGVPLFLREKALGTLAVGTSTPGRVYQPSDLAIALELGRRVSIAVENANLYNAIRLTARRKDEFLATLAHELRNPLAPLSNSLQIMKKANGNAELNEQARGFMERQVRQLRRLVDDLLEVSRINTGKFDLRREHTTLSHLVGIAVEAIQETIKARHRLTVTLPPEDVPLYVDPSRLAQVITNLLDNASKYTPAGGEVSLTAERHGSEISISVRDTGVGIKPDMVQRIFDLFVQGDHSIERSYGGLGVGLTLVKRLVEMHGGEVRAESAGAGMGSTFTLRLPAVVCDADRSPRSTTDAAAAPIAGGRKRNIVVVDDHRDSGTSLGALLELMGHDVHVAFDGAQGLDAVAQYQPEIVFLDIGMPEMTGYDVVRRLRAEGRTDSPFVVALSGYGTVEDKRRSKDAGFDMHVIKPIDLGKLHEIIATASPP